MKQLQETRLSIASSSAQSGNRKASASLAINQGSSNSYQNFAATAIVAVGFALFVFAVRYVMKTINYDEL